MIEILLQAEAALSVGLLDRAEILYRQVASADPRNSIAVVGLARVMLERGDEPGALAQARRALAIDAENAAAQRMVQRLDEVLRFRGVDVSAVPRGATTPVAKGATAEAPDARSQAEAPTGPEESRSSPESIPAPAMEPAPASDLVPRTNVPTPRSLVDRLLRRR